MTTLTLEIEKELPTLDAEAARQFERAVRAMLQMAKRRESPPSGLATQPYVTKPRCIGLKVGIDSPKWAELLDETEGPGWK